MDSREDATTKQVEHSVRRKFAQQMYDRKTDFSDRGRANLLRQIVGATLRYVVERKQWLMWYEGRWHVDDHESFVRSRALQVAYSYEEVAKVERKKGNEDKAKAAEKEALRCRNRATLDNMIHELAHTIGVPISVNELDRNPWLLGVANGVVDLRTGELRTQEAASDFVTKRCTVEYLPTAAAPRWERFIDEITGNPGKTPDDFRPRPLLARYLQKMLGYACTGSTREHKLFIAVGDGSNGKSQLFEAVERLLGPYSATLPAEALMADRMGADAERPSSLAASLAGARFVIASESKDGQHLDVGAVKNHTGDGKMTARRMRENPMTFDITHKLVLLTNVRPALDHMDTAIRGRLHLIPFDRKWNRPSDIERDPTLPDGDKELTETLRTESDGILAWLVRGAVLYQQEGLDPPGEVLALTRDFILTQDHIGRWLTEACERCSAQEGTLARDLFYQFGLWCKAEGVENPCTSSNAFGMALNRKAVESKQTRYGGRRGLRLVSVSDPFTTIDDATVDPLS